MKTASASIARPAQAAPAAAGRIASVDVVRGLTLILMILVNNAGDWDHVYAPLEHAAWNGFTPTDFIFPNFLFIVGVSIALALSGKRWKADEFGRIMLKVMKRGAILFFLGVLITAIVINFDFAHLRIPGVLQRIAVVFVIASALFLKAGDKTLAYTAFGLLVAYYLLMNFVPVPGFGPANLEPGTNLGAWLDRLVLTTDHLYRHTNTWDPEGILSTLPSISTGLFGVLAGIALKRDDSPGSKLKRFFGIGALFVIAGLAAGFLFPINKSLWSSSYVLLTTGMSLALLGFSYWLVDLRGSRWWTALFMAFGVNSIFAYLLSELFQTLLDKIPLGDGETGFTWIYKTLYVPSFASPYNASLAWAATVLIVFTPLLWFMYRRNIIVKV